MEAVGGIGCCGSPGKGYGYCMYIGAGYPPALAYGHVWLANFDAGALARGPFR